MMDYKYYLAQGMPIATGVVESACGYFIGKRLDANGMRWTTEGAQKIIDLRAIYLNEDWDKMIEFYIKKQQQELYEFYPESAA